MHGLEMLDHTVQTTQEWIKNLNQDLGWGNKPRTFRSMRAVLLALRDCLPAAEAADLAAQNTLDRYTLADLAKPRRRLSALFSIEKRPA